MTTHHPTFRLGKSWAHNQYCLSGCWRCPVGVWLALCALLVVWLLLHSDSLTAPGSQPASPPKQVDGLLAQRARATVVVRVLDVVSLLLLVGGLGVFLGVSARSGLGVVHYERLLTSVHSTEYMQLEATFPNCCTSLSAWPEEQRSRIGDQKVVFIHLAGGVITLWIANGWLEASVNRHRAG